MKIEQEISNIVLDELWGTDETELTPDVEFFDLGADSLDVIEIVMRLEEHYGIDIPDDDIKQIHSVRSAANYVNRKLGKKESQ